MKFPTCLNPLSPQQLTVPVARRAHVWLSPELICVASLKPETLVGTTDLVVVPFPS
jgi:hypothetical protein